jgi:uncharacterized damage-inducible protein DinB
MAMFVNSLRVHLSYSSWASNRLVGASSTLSPKELTRDFATADHNVLGTLAHIYDADRIWLGRVEESPMRPVDTFEVGTDLEALRRDWEALCERWRLWGNAQSEESIYRYIPYTNSRGDAYTTPVWQIVLHVVNHGSHHRGQVSGFLRAMGYVPPSLDLTTFYREVM